MAYTALIDAQLATAFKLAKDLAKDVVLTKKAGSSFDFTTNVPVHSTTQTITTKGVKIDGKKTTNVKASTAITAEMMFKTKEVGDISIFDSVAFGGETWKFGPVVHSSAFITMVQIIKEL